MALGVTMRPDNGPDVYIQESGQSCNLAQLDRKIRALQTARAWLVRETKKEKEQKK